ncbi:exosome complex protein Rrp42, partial [Candidatus Woesearchaeota archaeon]|nr:exosome complex protein Rrp42 [Candidatus Woesearchaeota archaeon]
EFRDVIIESGISNKAEGSARVRIGKTEVIVGVKLSTQEPYSDHADEGTMMTGMEFSPVSGERYESGPPSINAIEVSRVVDRGIRESGFIDWKGLCIEENKKVWSISIDMYCINDDGNVLDACSIAAVSALLISKFPVYDKETEMVKYDELTDTPLPLSKNIPFAMTFYKIGEELLVDPNREEEDSADSRLTLALSHNGKDMMINSMQKGELIPITGEDLDKVIEHSEKVYEAVFPGIDKQIKALK